MAGSIRNFGPRRIDGEEAVMKKRLATSHHGSLKKLKSEVTRQG